MRPKKKRDLDSSLFPRFFSLSASYAFALETVEGELDLNAHTVAHRSLLGEVALFRPLGRCSSLWDQKHGAQRKRGSIRSACVRISGQCRTTRFRVIGAICGVGLKDRTRASEHVPQGLARRILSQVTGALLWMPLIRSYGRGMCVIHDERSKCHETTGDKTEAGTGKGAAVVKGGNAVPNRGL